MPRYKLTIEYDGRPYVGWQRQNNGLSVQQVLEEGVAAFASEQVTVHGAGRTDAGVHASGQVAHITLSKRWRTDVIRDAANAHMRPQPIAILSAEEVPDDFEARFSAIRRHYVYRLCNRRAPATWNQGLVWHVARKLNTDAMQIAAQRLLGMHDFTTFRASECQATSPMRTLDRFDVVRNGEDINIYASARSFLHHQVRSMVGSLEHVGSGKWTADDLQAALEAKDRKACGMVSPPYGLYLSGVDYP